MKILHICSYLYPALTYGGPAKVVYDLSKSLSKNSTVAIYTTDVWDQRRRIQVTERIKPSKSLKVLYFPNIINSLAYSIRLFTGFGMIARFLKDGKTYDVIHFHDVYILPQLVIGYICLLIKKPFVFSPHGVLDPVRTTRRSLIKKLFWLIAKPIVSRASSIIATSTKEAKDLKHMGFENVIVIHNGIPDEKLTKIKPFSMQLSSKKTLLYVGKLHPQKGLIELIKAYKKVQDRYHLIIAGPDDGALADLLAFRQKNNLSDVHIVGYVDDAQKKGLFKVSDLFVYPSYAEGFSISILEALQAGVPVLITEDCNFPDVRTHKAGIIIPGKNIEKELVSVLKKIPTIKSFKSTYGKRAMKLIRTDYSIERMAAKCQSVYEAIV